MADTAAGARVPGVGAGRGHNRAVPAPRASSSGLGRRPSVRRPAVPRVGAVPNTGAVPQLTSRPVAAARPAGPQRHAPGKERGPAVERVRQGTPKLLSARAMVLGVVALLAFVLVYPTLHSYLTERAAVDALRAQVAAAQQQNDDLGAELARWDDPAYVAAQARERLSFVMPGETAWRVIDPETVPGEAPAPTVAPQAQAVPTPPWYLTVWQSVEGADRPAPEAATSPTPASTPSTPPSRP